MANNVVVHLSPNAWQSRKSVIRSKFQRERASRCTKAFRGSQEDRTRRHKLKTEGCTNFGRQISVTTKILYFGGIVPNICEFFGTEIASWGCLGAQKFWVCVYEFGELFAHFNYATTASCDTASTSMFTANLPPHATLSQAPKASLRKPTNKPETTVKYIQTFSYLSVKLARMRSEQQPTGQNEVSPEQLLLELHALVRIFTINYINTGVKYRRCGMPNMPGKREYACADC